MNKIFNYTLLAFIMLLTLTVGLTYIFKDIGLYKNESGLSEIAKETNIKKNTKISIPYKIPEDKLSIDKMNLLLIGGNKSTSITGVYEKNNELVFDIIVPNNEKRLEGIVNTYKGLLNKVSDKDLVDIYQINYNKEFIEYLLNNKIKLGDTFIPTELEGEVSIKDTQIDRYFNKDTIDQFELNKSYTTDKLVSLNFSKLFNQDFEINTLYNMRLKDIRKVNGFDIKEDSYPIITIYKQKYTDGQGILAENYNNEQYQKALLLYDNIEDSIADIDFIRTENDNKTESTNKQSIYNFTQLEPQKYFDYYIKNKDQFKIKKDNIKEGNKLLIETDKAYIVFYLDVDNKYPYDIKKLKVSGKEYFFDTRKYINVKSKMVTLEYFEKIMKDINKDEQLISIMNNGGFTNMKIPMFYNNIYFSK